MNRTASDDLRRRARDLESQVRRLRRRRTWWWRALRWLRDEFGDLP
jgi:hypothetical protein